MKRSRQPVEIDTAELRRALDRARQEPIGEADYLKLKVALDVLDEAAEANSDHGEDPHCGGATEACRQHQHAGG